MVATGVLALTLLGPPPAPSETAPDVSDARAHAGPTAISAEPGAQDVAVVGSDTPHDPKPFVPHANVQPSHRTRPDVPRLLTSIEGYPEDETKRFVHRGMIRFEPGIQFRSVVGAVTDFTLDQDRNVYDEDFFFENRVRWRPVLMLGRNRGFRLVGMMDVTSGRLAPLGSRDPIVQEIIDDGQPPVPTDARVPDLRELYIQVDGRRGQLRLGQMSFTWGQGLLVNDGNNMDRFGDLKFGDDGDGSIQERVFVATKPFQDAKGGARDLVVGLGGDLVFRDPIADLTDGDKAGQVFVVLKWMPENRPGNWVGAYTVYRRQNNADDGDAITGDDDLEVAAIDIAGQGLKFLRPKLALVGAFETVFVGGRTTWFRGERDDHKVAQGAVALRGYLGNPKTWLVGFDAGYLSGDSNPDDGQINQFNAAPGYTAGLLTFQWIRGWQSARSEILARDPALSGVPRNGTERIPTEGSVHNTVFIHPKARYAFAESFEIWGGPMIATAAVPIADPFTSRLRGGDPYNSLGGDGDNQYLGTEVDLGLRGRYGFKDLWFQAGVQVAAFFPGAGMENAAGGRDDAVWGTWFRFEVRY